MTKPVIVIILSLFLTGCSLQNNQSAPQPNNVEFEVSPSPSLATDSYSPQDPIEIFLIELKKSVGLPFENPVKADIFWSEGETSSTLKVFYGDSFLITSPNSSLENEKKVAEYLTDKGFALMKFNGSIGEDSRKMGYRKDDLICKTDYSIYPDETKPHLIVYCSDAKKGTLRK